ncbi:MAG: thioredoxin family protein [Bdellovibrionales bacterium]
MKNLLLTILISLVPYSWLHAQAVPGKPAPDFSAQDTSGKSRNLTEQKGKWVVLEWFNKDCPYVKKHYDSKNMQALQKKYTEKGVVWLSVISSAKGKQGHQTAAEALKTQNENGSSATAILLDESGVMGKAYGAKTTPHMYIINPEGQVVYAGAIDDNDSASPKVIPKSKNYVVAALDAGLSGQKIEMASTKPYGCSVKY